MDADRGQREEQGVDPLGGLAPQCRRGGDQSEEQDVRGPLARQPELGHPEDVEPHAGRPEQADHHQDRRAHPAVLADEGRLESTHGLSLPNCGSLSRGISLIPVAEVSRRGRCGVGGG